MVNILSNDEARELLSAERVGRLGCIAEGDPYVVPVNYVYDGEFAIIHSLPGRKIVAMRLNPRVCLQVDKIESNFGWRSVIVFGSYEEVTNRADRSQTLELLLKRFPELTPVETLIAEDAMAPSPIVFRIRIERMTGVGQTFW
jgi:nitroimidazol reductase NimA-like FMN-containing flavoprotein (pyridoxamine 5'-phosphate oxidase superfamily)